MKKERYYWTPDDVAEVTQRSKSLAYKLIQGWNKELAGKGFSTMRGRVPRQYAIDRLGLEARAT